MRQKRPDHAGRLYKLLFALCLACLPGAADGSRIEDKVLDARTFVLELKDGGRADIAYEHLVRTWYPGRAWLEGISQPHTATHYYIVITATVRLPAGQVRTITWIAGYQNYTYYYIRPGRLVLAGDEAFLEYTLVPMCTDERTSWVPPFMGRPGLLVKYGRYASSVPYRRNENGRRDRYPGTYQWEQEHLWDEVSEEEFDRAAGRGAAVNLDFGISYDDGSSIDYYAYWKQRMFRNYDHEEFLNVVLGGNREKVEALLYKDPTLINARDDKTGMSVLHAAARHLVPAMVRHGAAINAIDYKGRTPLHAAIGHNGVDQAYIDELIGLGGLVLYPECSFDGLVKVTKRSPMPRKVVRKFNDGVGWISDDVYQVRVDCGTCKEPAALGQARTRIIRELGLSGGPYSRVGQTLEHVVANADIACTRKKDGQKYRLARICAPKLRDMVREFNELKSKNL